MYGHPSVNYPTPDLPPLHVKKEPCTNALRLLDRHCRDCEDEVLEICEGIRASKRIRKAI